MCEYITTIMFMDTDIESVVIDKSVINGYIFNRESFKVKDILPHQSKGH